MQKERGAFYISRSTAVTEILKEKRMHLIQPLLLECEHVFAAACAEHCDVTVAHQRRHAFEISVAIAA